MTAGVCHRAIAGSYNRPSPYQQLHEAQWKMLQKEKENVAKTNFDTSLWQVLCYFKPGGATQMALALVILGLHLFIIKSIHQSGCGRGEYSFDVIPCLSCLII